GYEKFIDTRLDQATYEVHVRKRARVGLQADVVEALRLCGVVHIVEELRLERDLAARENHTPVTPLANVVVHRLSKRVERDAAKIVQTLLDDAEPAGAVAVEVDRDRQVLESRRLETSLVAFHQSVP